MIKYFILGLAFFLQSLGYAQLNISPIWCFGQKAGLDFGTTPPTPFTTNMVTSEGSSGATDENGEILFYTDGMNVYNKLHQVMPNGTGLTGSPSSSQSAIILQHSSQKSDNKFYVFTVPEYAGSAGFCYSIVDMDSDGGLGDVVTKNVNVFGILSEQMQPAMHSNGKDYWIVIKGHNNNNWYSFLIDQNGVSLKQTASLGNSIVNTIGCMRFNKSYSKFAYTCYDFSGYFQICDFDNSTGVVSNALVVDGLYDPYGVSFSLDSRFIYVSHLITKKVIQYDLINYTKTAILNSSYKLTNANYSFGNLNYGYDGNLYLIVTGEKYLAAIYNPDGKGVSSAFQLNAVSLGSNNGIYGLPLFYEFTKDSVHKLLLNINGMCLEDSFVFRVNYINGISHSWYLDTGDGYKFISNDSILKFKFNNTGYFKIRVSRKNDSIIQSFQVVKCKNKKPSFVHTNYCYQDTIHLVSNLVNGIDSIQWYVLIDNKRISAGTNSNFKYKFSKPGNYNVILKNDLDSFKTKISIFDCNDSCMMIIPNAFTPNGDSLNDKFNYVFSCRLTDFRVLVFNRWGEKLYDSTLIEKLWDGYYQGALCPDGVYFYIITFKDNTKKLITLNGVIHLIH